MKPHTYAFENLEVWKIARSLKKEIYTITKKFPREEMYGLTSQLKRSVGSISANIVEGSGRATDKDRAHFINISYASGLETIDHIITALDMEYINNETYESLRLDIDKLLNKLNAFHTYLLSRNHKLKK
ncbi:30S ribosomal protein S23 [Bacteroidetes bacterium UKL13-3]|jgi:four helix bundle protein|nr:30S ribosomal protein S23 [Bacteroidetes bacterium UKL13-3]